MTVLLAIAWGLPLFCLPQLGGAEATFFIPRATFLVYLAAFTPWWRGWWTWLEWGLLAAIVGQTARVHTKFAVSQGLVWAAGLVLLRGARGLSDADTAFVRRWWWCAIPPTLAYAIWQRVLPPGWDPFTMEIPGSSTWGNPLFTAEAALLLLGQAPWWVSGLGVATCLVLGSRGAILAALGGGLLSSWGILALPLTPAVAWWLWRHWGLGTLAIRTGIWRRTLWLIARVPWAGVGTGMFFWRVPQLGLKGEDWNLIGAAHNDYLERAAEWGIPVALLFALWILWLVRGSSGHTAVALVALTQFPFRHPATWPLFCLTAGLRRREGVSCRSPWSSNRDSLRTFAANAWAWVWDVCGTRPATWRMWCPWPRPGPSSASPTPTPRRCGD